MARPKGSGAKMTPEKVKEMEGYFAIGLTDSEACLMGDICRETLNKYCLANEWWREKKEILKRKPLIKAKSNLVKELNGHNVDVSKWYAERKGRGEFALKVEQEIVQINKELPVSKKALKEELKRIEEEENKL